MSHSISEENHETYLCLQDALTNLKNLLEEYEETLENEDTEGFEEVLQKITKQVNYIQEEII